MEDDSSSGAPAERARLLEFEPVPRKCARRDGWTAERQRDFVALLAVTGCRSRAAHAVGLTERGAYQLRRDAGAEDFIRAWDAALAFHEAWTAPSRPAAAPSAPHPAPAAAAPDPERELEPDEERQWDAFMDSILMKYLLKLDGERRARLAGRIVEADFYVRQLTWLEVALDCGGRAHELLGLLESGGYNARRIAATPMSLLLDEARRALWAKEGGPERPPPAALGLTDGEVAFGAPPECQTVPGRGAEHQAVAARAQRLWEEKARAEAAEWAKRAETQTAPTRDDTMELE